MHPNLAFFSNYKEIISSIRMSMNKIIVRGEIEDVEGIVRIELQDETVLDFLYAFHVLLSFETKYASNRRPNWRRKVPYFWITGFIWSIRSNWVRLNNQSSLFLGREGWYIKLISTHFLSSVRSRRSESPNEYVIVLAYMQVCNYYYYYNSNRLQRRKFSQKAMCSGPLGSLKRSRYWSDEKPSSLSFPFSILYKVLPNQRGKGKKSTPLY